MPADVRSYQNRLTDKDKFLINETSNSNYPNSNK
jgi:hypothetical protein